MTRTENTAVVGYIRVSTTTQADGGVSLAAQRAKLEAYCVAMDLELVAIETDAGLSAKSLKRPGLQAALAMLTDGRASGLLITKLDRLTRSVRDLGDLVETYFASRFALLSLGDSIDTRSAAGRLILNVLASVSQWEREATGERTRDALTHIRDNEGATLGGAPLGQVRTTERDKHGRLGLAVVSSEVETVERILVLRADGLSLRAVAEQLTAEGRRTKRGGSWYASTVRNVLKRVA